MDLIKIRNEIIDTLSPEQIETKIVSDLHLEVKNKKYICFMHSDSHPSLSFDYNLKQFKCFACGGIYNLIDHYMQHYGLTFYESLQKIIDDFGLTNIELLKPTKRKTKSKPIKHDNLADVVVNYLALRHISKKTIDHSGIKSDNNNIVFVYNDESGMHISNKYRPAKKIVNKDELKMWFQKDTNVNTLYNMDKVDLGQSLVICEGEIDCLSLIEAGYKNAVSVPTGATSEEWIDSCWEWLSQFKEIIVWYDNDAPGRDGARKVANRLPNDSVKVVYSMKANDINEILYKFGKQTVLNELNKAVELEIDGVLTMNSISDFNVYEAEKIKTGIALLDQYIMGTVMGSLVITTGYNGGGKSTLLNQMCIAEPLSQGYKVFAFSGELTPNNFKFWLYTTLTNEHDFVEATTKDGRKYVKTNDAAKRQLTEWINDKLFLYDKNDNSEDAILKMMEILAKRKGVRVFVLDNLMKIVLNNTFRNDLLAQRLFVDKLKAFAVKYQAVVHLVAHPRKPSETGQKVTKFDVCGSGDIINLADYIIAVHRATEKEKQEYKEYKDAIDSGAKWNGKGAHPVDPRDGSISLFKDRPTGTSDKEARLYFDSSRKRFYSHVRELEKDYGYGGLYKQEELPEEDWPF
ncbi:toprim domain-containing protein [Cellulosilyticum sp. I15G10I2]|uniref:toprim domain-containing protein n=1 Tax=Cellulosilyticum sp. I15G10I2 TaxID=1892843 RepID=UPI00085C6332|nr:toprim domain-containing protein [Cellulosilyticum sp. I15G10I2]